MSRCPSQQDLITINPGRPATLQKSIRWRTLNEKETLRLKLWLFHFHLWQCSSNLFLIPKWYKRDKHNRFCIPRINMIYGTESLYISVAIIGKYSNKSGGVRQFCYHLVGISEYEGRIEGRKVRRRVERRWAERWREERGGEKRREKRRLERTTMFSMPVDINTGDQKQVHQHIHIGFVNR